jgi:uncharacterized OsmC-like protein
VLHSKNSKRPLPNLVHQGCHELSATKNGIDPLSLVLVALICCLCLLAALWAAYSGWDLSASWL